MFYKLVLLVLTVATAAAAQLSIRHQRLQAVHDMTAAINEGADLERRFQALRVQVAKATTPQRILLAGQERWDLKPIPIEWSTTPSFAYESSLSDWVEPLPERAAYEYEMLPALLAPVHHAIDSVDSGRGYAQQ